MFVLTNVKLAKQYIFSYDDKSLNYPTWVPVMYGNVDI